MELPGKESCIVEKLKVTEYLLNTSRMPAAAKARFFLASGFRSDEWQELASALKRHAEEHTVLNEVRSDYGMKYEIEGPLCCPDGRSPVVRTVWQIDTDGLAPRLITAYPIQK
jgi:hypothetical protein